ncbi:MAG: pseudouridine synthase [Bryobacteraceae bacterium]|nr:pseudouridine synthase [Bryobacteraceae bacterium]MDW8377557.1 pseudouridine synthase [Bryobacterales bacterium]
MKSSARKAKPTKFQAIPVGASSSTHPARDTKLAPALDTPRHILFYKPYGVLSQFSDRDGRGHPTLALYIPYPDLYPAGRLDRDSEGLLLLTCDGRLQHRLTDPRYGHRRTYWVQVERVPSEDALAALRSGVVIQGVRTRPCEVRLLESEPPVPPRNPPIRYRKSVPTAWLEMTLREGRNRQVRRMTAAVGHPTLRLIRVAIGDWRLEGLAPGQWREIHLDGTRRKSGTSDAGLQKIRA